MNEYEQLLQAAEAALKAGDVEKANELMASAETVKTKMDAQAKLAGLQADATAKAETAAVAAKATLDAEVEARVKAALKGQLQRPPMAGGDDDVPSIAMRGPFDDVDASHLALGYQVLKAAGASGRGQGPSLDYRRAVHGRAVRHVGLHSLPSVVQHDEASPVMEHLKMLKSSRSARPLYFHQASDNRVLKALSVKADELMGSDVVTAGDEWVPVFYSRELFRLIRNEAMVASMFRQLEIAAESFVFPIQTGSVTWYKTPQTDDVAELSYGNAFVSDRVSQVATSKMTLTPVKLSALVIWTGELNEQSLVPMLPFLQEEMVTSGAHVLDELLISGDKTTDNTNISDTGNGAISTLFRILVLDGLRHVALVDTAANSRSGGALTADDFLETKKLMGVNGKNAVRPSSVFWLMDHLLYYKMLALGEVLTLDKFGPMMTIDQGVIQRIWGSLVINSDDYGSTDANGKIHTTPGNNTLGSFMCIRPDQGAIGFGRRLTIEVSRIARSDANEIVAHMMVDFDMATDEAVGLTYNVTV